MEWRNGTRREGCLRMPDAQAFTTAATAEVPRRRVSGDVRPGADTPATLFGSSLAEDLGASFMVRPSCFSGRDTGRAVVAPA